jgi:predicted ABC-class ATPase
MKDKQEFHQLLSEINGQNFSEYARIIGDFDFSRYVVKFNRVPAEGEGNSVLFVVRVPQAVAEFPPHLTNTPIRRTALEDLLTRRMAEAIERTSVYDHEGVSRRRISIAVPGQKILPRSSLVVADEFVEARLTCNLPARHGRILGEDAQDVFFRELPGIVNSSLIYCNLEEREVERFVDLMEDADAVRQALPTRGLISFVGEGSRLTRRDRSDLPDLERTQPLQMAEALRLTVEVPNAGPIRGMGIPSGITVILGDAYSGRPELMKALAAGIYNHIPEDGRDYVVSVPDTVYVAAEDRRSVQRVDISAFVRKNPAGRDVKQYTVAHADPCAAQAAATAEALEIGARALLFDEADSNSGFLCLDSRLKGLSSSTDLHFIPLSVRARQIADELGVSIVVAGASSVTEFIPVADTVLRIDDFQVSDVTREAKALAIQMNVEVPADRSDVSGLAERSRWVVPSSIDPSQGRYDAVVDAPSVEVLHFGSRDLDLRGLAQLADRHQTSTIGLVLHYAKMRYMDEGRPIREILDLVDRDLSTEGLECLSRELRGDLARPRRYEIAAALNRLPTLRISRVST